MYPYLKFNVLNQYLNHQFVPRDKSSLHRVNISRGDTTYNSYGTDIRYNIT